MAFHCGKGALGSKPTYGYIQALLAASALVFSSRATKLSAGPALGVYERVKSSGPGKDSYLEHNDKVNRYGPSTALMI